MDSVRLFRKEDPRIVVRLDTRGSFISNEPVNIHGVKVGWEHARRFQYGFGYSVLLKPVHRERQIVEAGGLRNVDMRLRMGYVNAFAEYAFYQRRRWTVRIPVQVGVGHGSVVYEDLTGTTRKWQKTWFATYEPAMVVQFRFLKYFGLQAGFGYRLVFRASAGLGEQLTAPIYVAGIKVFTGDLWRDLRK